MAYRVTAKRKKIWSQRANIKKAMLRMETAALESGKVDTSLRITVERIGTGETAIFECSEGDRIDNYCVYCNGKYQGVQSITTITNNLRKALPSFGVA